jgi:hypothetical protein
MTSSSDAEAEKLRIMSEQTAKAVAAAAEAQLKRAEAQALLKKFEADSEKSQLFFMMVILVLTISAGTILMAVSLAMPMFFMASNPRAPPEVLEQWGEAPKDVLPFATGLIGFAGGLVTAIYGKSVSVKASQLQTEKT